MCLGPVSGRFPFRPEWPDGQGFADAAAGCQPGSARHTPGVASAMGAVQQPDGPMTQSLAAPLCGVQIQYALAALVVSGCMGNAGAPQNAMPVMRWDHHPEASEWTEATLDALKAEGFSCSSPRTRRGLEQFVGATIP